MSKFNGIDQVYVYSSVDESGENDAPPFIARTWPDQLIVLEGLTSRENAPGEFLEYYNAHYTPNKSIEDFRFFGPMWLGVEVFHEDGMYRAYAVADKPYQVIEPTVEDAQEAFLDLWNNTPDNRQCASHNVSWLQKWS